MSEGSTATEPPLVAGRECGSCSVCCVALTINAPGFQKLQGYPCENIMSGGGCAIHLTRPPVCRAFYCGWRQMKWVRQTLRPDVSGVLVRPHDDPAPADGLRGMVFTLLHKGALEAEGLAESVAAAVAAGVPVYLHVPGPPGYSASHARMNEALVNAVLARDKAAVLHILRQAWAKGNAQTRKRIVLAPKPPERTAEAP